MLGRVDRARGDQRGVTLVELVVALMLLTVALIVLAASFPSAMYGVVAGGYQTTATLLAQQSVDRARTTLYGNLCSLDTGGSFNPITGTSYDGFRRQIAVAPCPNTASFITTVTVVVRFVGVGGAGGGTIYDTTLATMVAQ